MTRVGITLGDPAGIGPEVAVKALRHHDRPRADFVVYGPAWALALGAKQCGVPVPDCETVDVDVGEPAGFRVGAVAARCGEAAVQAVERCARMPWPARWTR